MHGCETVSVLATFVSGARCELVRHVREQEVRAALFYTRAYTSLLLLHFSEIALSATVAMIREAGSADTEATIVAHVVGVTLLILVAAIFTGKLAN
jgi:hypothetical protein